MSDELAFEALLSEHNESYGEAEEFGDDWMPDDYDGLIVAIMDVKTGTYTKNDKTHAFWRLMVQIESPEHEDNGKEFCMNFLTTAAPGIIKTMARKFNDGVSVDDLAQASDIVVGSVGTVMSVNVKTGPDKNGVERTNCYIKEILAEEPVKETADAKK